MLHGFGKPRGRDVNRLFEVRAFERIGLIKDRQFPQNAIPEKTFDGYFLAGDVSFHKHLIEIRLASGKYLPGLLQAPDACRRSEKLLSIVCAHYTLARRKRKRLQNAWIGDSQEYGLGRGINGKIPKPWDIESGISKDFFHAQLAAAGFHGGGMVVTDSLATSGISGSGGGPIAESKNPADVLATKRFHHCVGSHFRRFEMHGDRLIAPGIFQLVASIGNINKLHAQLARGIFKTARLVTELRGKKQQSFGRMCHVRRVLCAGIKQSYRRSRLHFSPVALAHRWKSTGRG